MNRILSALLIAVVFIGCKSSHEPSRQITIPTPAPVYASDPPKSIFDIDTPLDILITPHARAGIRVIPGAQQTVSTGTVANDGTGDSLRTAFTKLNANETELYATTDRTTAGLSTTSNRLESLNTASLAGLVTTSNQLNTVQSGLSITSNRVESLNVTALSGLSTTSNRIETVNSALTAAKLDITNGFSLTNLSALNVGLPFNPNNSAFIANGDSLLQGSFHPVDYLTTQFPGWSRGLSLITNLSVGGSTIEDITNRWVTQVAPLIATLNGQGITNIFYLFDAGANNVYSNASTFQQTWSNHVWTAKSSNCTVITFDILPQAYSGNPQSQPMTNWFFNNAYIQQRHLTPYLIQWSRMFPHSRDTNYYNTDAIHLNTNSSFIVAATIDAMLRGATNLFANATPQHDYDSNWFLVSFGGKQNVHIGPTADVRGYVNSTTFPDFSSLNNALDFSRSDGVPTESVFAYTGTNGLSNLGFATRGNIEFVAGGTAGPALTIDTSGNAGLGGAPQSNTKWTVVGNVYINGVFLGANGTSTDWRLARSSDTTKYISLNAPGGTYVSTTLGISGTSVATFDTNGGVSIGTYSGGGSISPTNGLAVSGRVGVGIVAPAYPLDVVGAIHNTSSHISDRADNLAFWAPSGGVYAAGSVSNYFAGPIGVGTLSPAAKLEVIGTGTSTDFRVSRSGGSPSLTFAAPGGTYGTALLALTGTPSPGIAMHTNGSAAFGSYASGSVQPPTNSLVVSGNLGVGLSNPVYENDTVGRVHSTSSHISDRADALAFWATAGGATFSGNVSNYFAGPITTIGGIVTSSLTNTSLAASRAIVTDANKKQTSSATTDTEIGYVAGVTSAIQTQIDTKLSKSIWTTKGDILTATSTATPARLPVGTDGQILVADSASAGGIKWTNSPSGTAPTYTVVTVSGAGSSYTVPGVGYCVIVTGGGSTVTLPTAVGNAGVPIIVKSHCTADAAIATTSSQTIDAGGTTLAATGSQYQTYTFISDNANWWIVGKYP